MDAAGLYLDLLKRCLTRSLFTEEETREVQLSGLRRVVLSRFLNGEDKRLFRPVAVDAAVRAEGKDWPPAAETMIGLRRLDNVQACVESVIRDDIPGDLIEAGVWRGGATILMRAVLAAHGVTDRTVWVADSFEGLPAADIARYPRDRNADAGRDAFLAVGLEAVRGNFERYGLLDDGVRFLPGWFKDTLPRAPIERLAVLRLDGDLYESTLESLEALYPKLSIGGYLIVDDFNHPGWGALAGKAVTDYRERNGITEPIREIDWTGIYWRRER